MPVRIKFCYASPSGKAVPAPPNHPEEIVMEDHHYPDMLTDEDVRPAYYADLLSRMVDPTNDLTVHWLAYKLVN